MITARRLSGKELLAGMALSGTRRLCAPEVDRRSVRTSGNIEEV